MALGALISAYQETRGAELVAVLPLAGRTLVEYQARLAAAAGADVIVVLVERMPPPLLAAVDRLTGDGIAVQLARGVSEAASFFAPSDRVLLMAGGLFADTGSVERIAGVGGSTVLTIADNIGLDAFERIDGARRWAGLAQALGAELSATAAMLGDWDLQSTLLRRLVQGGARLVAAETGLGAPMLLMASEPADLVDAERRIVAGARGGRGDWVERYVTPLIEEWGTQRLLGSGVRPHFLVAGAALLTLLAAALFLGGWRGAGLAALVASLPLDGLGERLAAVRLQPLLRGDRLRASLGPCAAAALAALAIDLAAGEGGWGVLVAALAGLGFLYAITVERRRAAGTPAWLATRKGCILLGVPFAAAGLWTAGLVAVTAYAAASFLWLQRRGTRAEGLSAR